MSYEFAGTLFNFRADAEMACVKTWLCGDNNEIDVPEMLCELDNLAEEMAEEWLDIDGNKYTFEDAKSGIKQALLEIMAEDPMRHLHQARAIEGLRLRIKMVLENPYWDKNSCPDIEWDDMPLFGGDEPCDTLGIISWDEKRVLTGDLELIAREEL